MGKIGLILLCVVLTGCAGMADYTISLDNGFRIDRLSGHQIIIYGDKPVQSLDKTVSNYSYVPSKVTDVWWNEEYIVAKQMVLKADKYGYEEPPKNPTENDFKYWIIDVTSRQPIGPLNETELVNETDKLGLTEIISLTSIEKLR